MPEAYWTPETMAIRSGAIKILARYRDDRGTEYLKQLFPHPPIDGINVTRENWVAPNGKLCSTLRVREKMANHWVHLYSTIMAGSSTVELVMGISADRWDTPGAAYGEWSFGVYGAPWHPLAPTALMLRPLDNVGTWGLPQGFYLADGTNRMMYGKLFLGQVLPNETGFPYGFRDEIVDFEPVERPSVGPHEDSYRNWKNYPESDWLSMGRNPVPGMQPWRTGDAGGQAFFGHFPMPGVQFGFPKEALTTWLQWIKAEGHRPDHYDFRYMNEAQLRTLPYHMGYDSPRPDLALIGRNEPFHAGRYNRYVPDPRDPTIVYRWWLTGQDEQHCCPMSTLIAMHTQEPHAIDMARELGYQRAAARMPAGPNWGWIDYNARGVGRSTSTWWRAWKATRDLELLRLLDVWVREFEPHWAQYVYGDPDASANHLGEPILDCWWAGILARGFAPLCTGLPTVEGRRAARKILAKTQEIWVASIDGDEAETMRAWRYIATANPHRREYEGSLNDMFGVWNHSMASVRMPANRALWPRLDKIREAIKVQSGIASRDPDWLDKHYTGGGAWATKIYNIPAEG